MISEILFKNLHRQLKSKKNESSNKNNDHINLKFTNSRSFKNSITQTIPLWPFDNNLLVRTLIFGVKRKNDNPSAWTRSLKSLTATSFLFDSFIFKLFLALRHQCYRHAVGMHINRRQSMNNNLLHINRYWHYMIL